jgi:DNA-binding NtrC family response regulator
MAQEISDVVLVYVRRPEPVVEASDGREAVELATRERPDVILMDLSMPVMDAVEAISCLRARIAHGDSFLPILCTGRGAVVSNKTFHPAWMTLHSASQCRSPLPNSRSYSSLKTM